MTNALESFMGVLIQETTPQLTSTTAPTTQKDIQDLHKYIDVAEDGVKALVAAVNLALDHMAWYTPDSVIEKVHRKTNKLTMKADIGLAAFRTSVYRIGKPWTLRTAADEWSTRVKKELSPLSGLLATSQIKADEKFEGQSADAYDAIRWDYADALAALARFVDPISTGLDKIASAADKKATAHTVAIISLIAGIFSAYCAVVTAATGYGALVGVCAATVCIATLAGAVMYAATEMDTAAQDVVGSWNLTAEDWDNFGGRKWPYPKFQ